MENEAPKIMKIYKFFWDCGRMGNVESLFFSEDKEIESAIGKYVYFGEILGKHSEVYGKLERKDLTILDLPSDVVSQLFEAVKNKTISGYNPLDYLNEEQSED